MERKINEIFEIEKEQYKVVKSDKPWPDKCINCDLYDDERGCVGLVELTGDCLKEWRDDKKDMIFKKV